MKKIINESAWLLGDDVVVRNTERVSLMETLSFIVGMFEAMEDSKEDFYDANMLDLIDEISEMEDVVTKVREKLETTELNEDISSLSIAIPSLISLVAGASAALFKKWAADGTLLPKGLENVSFKLGGWIKTASSKEEQAARRKKIEDELAKKMPRADKDSIKRVVADMEKRYEESRGGKENAYKPPKDSGKHGTYDTEFARAMRYKNMTDKEREEYNNKRFPNRKKK